MNARWERKKNSYFAYVRHSSYHKDTKKVTTENIYLGKTIIEAVANLKAYLESKGLSNDLMIQQLKSEGEALGVAHDDYRFNPAVFNDKFRVTADELYELIGEAETPKKRKEAQKIFLQLFNDITSYVNAAKEP